MVEEGWQAFLTSGLAVDNDEEFPSLRERPELYPGKRLPSGYENFFYHRGRIWPLAVGRNQRLTKARIQFRDSQGRLKPTPLPTHLMKLGSTDAVYRIPVIAVGSNAYPRQIYDKLHERYIDDAIPLVKGVLSNCEIVYCPYKAKKGYIPVTPRFRAGAKSVAWLMLLSPEQLQAIIETELSYRLVQLEDIPFTVDSSGERLSGCYAFWHEYCLRLRGDLPVICKDTLLEEHDLAEIRDIYTEVELLEKLNKECLLERLKDLALENPIQGARIVTDASEENLITYGTISSTFPEEEKRGTANTYRVRKTGPKRDHPGRYEPLAYLPASLMHKHNLKGYCTVYVELGDWINAVPARALRNDRLPEGEVQLDQMIRDALGVSLGERCKIGNLRRPFLLRVMEGISQRIAPRAVIARVVKQTGIMERPFCWANPELMDVLGLDPGGYVVLRAARPIWRNGTVEFVETRKRLQVFPVPPGVLEERRGVLQPHPQARFPDPSDILGVYPDLPWIWLDAENRHALGLDKLHPCSPVLVSLSGSYLLQRLISRFMVSILGIGAGVGILLHNVLGKMFSQVIVVGGLNLADVIAIGFMVLAVLGGFTVMVLDSRRPRS